MLDRHSTTPFIRCILALEEEDLVVVDDIQACRRTTWSLEKLRMLPTRESITLLNKESCMQVRPLDSFKENLSSPSQTLARNNVWLTEFPLGFMVNLVSVLFF